MRSRAHTRKEGPVGEKCHRSDAKEEDGRGAPLIRERGR